MEEIKKKALSAVKRMSEATICKHLLESFGIEASPDDFTKDQLVELFMDAQAAYFAENGGGDEGDDNETPESIYPEEEKVLINISKEKGEPPYVDASINGRASRIPRGIDVEVPRSVLDLLNSCIQTFYEHDSETGENTPNDEPRFNIQVKS